MSGDDGDDGWEEEDDWRRGSRPDDLEAAWGRVMDELPERWSMAGVQRGSGPFDWVATVAGPGRAGMHGYGTSPAFALDDLHDRLKGMKSEAAKKRLPPPF